MIKYDGWSLYDKVMIVSKVSYKGFLKDGKWVREKEEIPQGYVVDPNNKKQIDTAMGWAEQYEYGPYNNEKKDYEYRNKLEGQQYIFDNDGFILELVECADGSSQGGKLSFWNCYVTSSDNHKFKIGIATDLLLDILLTNTFVNGLCTEKLCFARKSGRVGMLTKDMPAYIQAKSDMMTKKNITTGKTKAWKIGHRYDTLTESNILICKLYQWYRPIMVADNDYFDGARPVGFMKLPTPITIYYAPHFEENEPLSYYVDNVNTYDFLKTLPSRKENAQVLPVDINPEDIVTAINKDCIIDYYVRNKYMLDLNYRFIYRKHMPILYDWVGIGTSATEPPTFPHEVAVVLKELNLYVTNS